MTSDCDLILKTVQTCIDINDVYRKNYVQMTPRGKNAVVIGTDRDIILSIVNSCIDINDVLIAKNYVGTRFAKRNKLESVEKCLTHDGTSSEHMSLDDFDYGLCMTA